MARIVIENATEDTAPKIGRLDGLMRRLARTVTSLSFTNPNPNPNPNPKRETARA